MTDSVDRRTPDRRTVMIGGALIAAAAVPVIIGTQRRARLLGGHTLDTLVPRRIAGWRAVPTAALIGPDDPNEGLYDAVLQRTYSAPTEPAVMLAVAYGMATTLNRHRPDICYPAQGFTIDASGDMTIALPDGVTIPGRRLLARRGDRRETIVYWRRMGDTIPSPGSDESLAIWRSSLAGEIPDGALVRMSIIGGGYDAAVAILRRFATMLVANASPAGRLVLLGPTTDRATLRTAAAP